MAKVQKAVRLVGEVCSEIASTTEAVSIGPEVRVCIQSGAKTSEVDISIANNAA
jgi:hypothetical protein